MMLFSIYYIVYSPDMPKRLPIRDIISGLFGSLGTAVRYWLHYTLVALCWLGIVPLTACKISPFFQSDKAHFPDLMFN